MFSIEGSKIDVKKGKEGVKLHNIHKGNFMKRAKTTKNQELNCAVFT